MAAQSTSHEARRRVGPKRERIGPVIERLAEEHPDAVIALRFRDELELLVSVMLSAQTTDVTVNRVTEKLFRKYRSPEDYLAVPPEELERDLRPTGTFRQKAKNLRGTMRLLLEEFDGRVPGDDRGARAPAGRGAEDGERRRRRARRGARDRRRHARPPALAAPRLHAAGGPGEDRARPGAARPAGATGLGSRTSSSGTGDASATPAARGAKTASSPTSAPRAASRLRRLARRERDEEPAVLVVGGEEVGPHLLRQRPSACAARASGRSGERPTRARARRGSAPRRSPRRGPPSRRGRAGRLPVAGELEDALAGRDDAAVAGRRRRSRSPATGSSRPSARRGSRSRSSGTRPPDGSCPRGRRRPPTAAGSWDR